MVIFFSMLDLVASIITVIMGTIILFWNPRASLNRVFAVLCFFIGYWAFMESQLRVSSSYDEAYMYIRLLFPFAITIALFVHFALIFTGREKALRKPLTFVLIYGSMAAVSLSYLLTDNLRGTPVLEYWGWTYGSFNWSLIRSLQLLVITILIAVALHYCFRFYLDQTDPIAKKRAGYVLIGLAIPAFAGFISEIFLALLHEKVPELTNVGFAIGVAGFIAFAIIKYDLFVTNPTVSAEKVLLVMSDSLFFVNREGLIVSTNRAALELLGFKENELVGSAIDSICEGCLDQLRSPTNGDGNGDAFSHTEASLTSRDGKQTPASISCSPSYDNRGNLQGYILIARDISEQKLAEQAIRDSELRYRTLFEMSPDGIMLIDLQGVITMCNRQIYQTHGFERKDQLVGRRNLDFIPSEYREQAVADLKALVENPGPLGSGPIVEYPLERADGGYWPATIKGSVLRDAQGRPVGFMLILRDVTDLKEAEEALRESESRYRTLFETSPDGIGVSDLSGKILICNRVLPQILGYDGQEEIIGKHSSDFVAPEERQQVAESIPNAVDGSLRNTEFNSVKKDGTTVPVEVSVSPMLDPDGKPQSLLFELRDITDRKSAEETLRESEQRFRKIFEEGPLGMAFVDTDLRFAKVNATLCRMVGYSEEELTGLSFSDITHPDDAGKDIDSAKKMIKGEIPSYRTEKRYLRKDGSQIWVSLTASVVRDKEGDPVYTIGMIEDISNSKKFEQQILNQSQQLQKANDELLAYNRVSNVISQTIELDQLISDVLALVNGMNVFNAERKGGIMLVEGNQLRLVAHTGHSQEFIDAHLDLNVDDCLCGLAVRTGEIITSSSALDDERCTIRYPGMQNHGYVILPLKAADRVVGVMHLNLPLGAEIDESLPQPSAQYRPPVGHRH